MANCEQDISALTARRLLTYEKIPFDDEQQEIKSEDVTDLLGDFRNKYVSNLRILYYTINTDILNFLYRFFAYGEESRQVRRIRKAELKEIGRQEALNRGKRLDENGKVTTKPLPVKL